MGREERRGRDHVSDLPPAAGLSSSSALLVAFTLASAASERRQHPSFEEFMEVLPEGRAIRGHARRRHGSRRVSRVTGGLRLADRVRSAIRAAHSGAAGLGISGGAQPARRPRNPARPARNTTFARAGRDDRARTAGLASYRQAIAGRTAAQLEDLAASARCRRRARQLPARDQRSLRVAPRWRHGARRMPMTSDCCCALRMPACATGCMSVARALDRLVEACMASGASERGSPAPDSAAAWSCCAARHDAADVRRGLIERLLRRTAGIR